jgi:hypothetical protein
MTGGTDGKLERVLSYVPGQTQYICMNPVRIGPSWKQGFPTTDRPAYFPVKKKNVAQVRALVVDLDVGRAGKVHEGMSPASAIAAFLVLGDAWGVPPASLVATSGRGVYALWLLHPLDILNSPDFDPVVKLWERAEAQLLQRLGNLSADAGAKCVVHWFKRPGTTDTLMVEGVETKTGRAVDYFTLIPNLADVPVYELPALVESTAVPNLLDFQNASSRPTRAAPVDTTVVGAGSTRGAQPSIRRIRDLKALNEARGGIREGLRAKFIFLLTVAATEIACRQRAGFAEAEADALKKAIEEGARFKPPMAESQIRAEIRSIIGARRRGSIFRVSNDGAAQMLQVTPEEAEALDLVSLTTVEVKAAREQATAARRTWREDWARIGLGSRRRARTSASRQVAVDRVLGRSGLEG